MRVYIAGATDARQYIKSYRSFIDLKMEPGDKVAEPSDYARGDVTRIRFGSDFLSMKEFDAILLLDLDMVLPPDTLQKLRAHDLDMVTGHYFKRGGKPMMSICSVGDKWPYEPLFDVPTEGLHEVSNSGFGCVLIKREVVEAVAETLREREPVFALGPMPEMSGDYGTFGSDFRFFKMARDLGYKLWLDASIECPHATVTWLTRKLYEIMRPHQADLWMDYWKKHIEFYGGLNGMDKDAALVRLKALNEALKQAQQQAAQWTDKVKVISGQIAEREFDSQIDAVRPAKIPVLSTEQVRELVDKRKLAPGGADEKQVVAAREGVNTKLAQEFVDELQA